MTNAKHTPLHNALLIGDEDLGFILSLHNSDGTNYANIKLFGSKKQCEANASFIVTAVNNFDLLVKALNDIIASNTLTEAKEYANETMRKVQGN